MIKYLFCLIPYDYYIDFIFNNFSSLQLSDNSLFIGYILVNGFAWLFIYIFIKIFKFVMLYLVNKIL